MQNFKSGSFYGTGSAVNIELGFIPAAVDVHNVSDGDIWIRGYPGIKTMAYTSGGTNEIKAGDTIKGATSGATARVAEVLKASGTWAGGDAAGILIIDAVTVSGTFASEAIYVVGGSSLDDATGAALGTPGFDSDTEITSNTGISAYLGSSGSASHGFTVSSGNSESGKHFRYIAWRNAAG